MSGKIHNLELKVEAKFKASLTLSVWDRYKGLWIENRLWLCLHACLIIIAGFLVGLFHELGLLTGLIGFFAPTIIALVLFWMQENEKLKKSFISFFEYTRRRK
jgi:hypothetical protein